MDKLKLASSSLGERLKTGSAQMTRLVSTKVRSILQPPTPESRMVDDATSDHLEEPDWGMNLRICAMINAEEFSGAEVVRAVKRKLSGKSDKGRRLGLDLLEACTSNCEKVFSEVASEKVLDEMVRVIEDPRCDGETRVKALELVRAWGESEDLKYLPVFHQTYMNLKTREIPQSSGDGNGAPMQYSLESYIDEQPMSPPERYPVPDSGLHGADNATFPYGYGIQSIEEKKEILEITRNSLEILSSILNSGSEPKPIKDDLTVSMFEKCKQSLPVVQRVAETTTDDEVMLFEALHLNEELQQIISKYEEMEAALSSASAPPENPHSAESDLPILETPHSAESDLPILETPHSAESDLPVLETRGETEMADSPSDEKQSSSGTQKLDFQKKEHDT
ncbi:hypothetical protein RHGRI_002829 [Rhododendron griersonianum]|uniref:TOM1-like protein 2 n=1 Tax=Rhododendron griersonianum TaxID=479676 RepID=A0AAV6LR36_9ERIC|nr:hypothetical protein RHGRI_002829 [Rhododendron griersonianum]